MYKGAFLVGFIALIVVKVSRQEATQRRYPRGLLSRTGLCPNPHRNFQTKDNRLNVFGVPHIVRSENPVTKPCQENECVFDAQCRGDERCCKNICGASVCTKAMRDLHPCSMFKCPEGKVCNLQRVKCIFPDCPDLFAVKRPMCVTRRESKEEVKVPEDVYFTPKKPFFAPSG